MIHNEQIHQKTAFNTAGLASIGQCVAKTSGTLCDAPPQSRDIPIKVAALFETTDYLSARVAKLAQRLSPALMPGQPDDDKASSPQSSTSLGTQLLELRLRLELICRAVDDLDSRLEI